MPSFLTLEQLKASKTALEAGFATLVTLLSAKEDDEKEIQAKQPIISTSGEMRVILTNNALTKNIKKTSHPKNAVIDTIKQTITGITIEELKPMFRTIEECKNYLSKVVIYNTLATITYSLFDEQGIARDFFLGFLTAHAEFTPDYLARIKNPADQANTDFYHAATNALLFMCVDTMLAQLAEPIFEELRLLSKKSSAKQEQEKSQKREDALSIVKTITALRNQLFGLSGTPCDITIADQVTFVSAYVELQAGLQEVLSLAADEKKPNIACIINNPSLTIWEKFQQVTQIPGITESNKTIETLCEKIKRYAENTAKFQEKKSAINTEDIAGAAAGKSTTLAQKLTAFFVRKSTSEPITPIATRVTTPLPASVSAPLPTSASSTASTPSLFGAVATSKTTTRLQRSVSASVSSTPWEHKC